MKRNIGLIATSIFSFALMAQAGTISGTISGAKGASVVYVNAPAGKTYPAPKEKQTLDQKGLMFQPHIMVVQQGTTVDFLNSDNVAHNVFWPSISGNKKLSHNMGTWPKDQNKPFKFDNSGVVTLLCNVHPEMSGFLVVSPSPYYAVSDENGKYKIENVPEGAYSVTIWHEGTKPQSKQLTVAADTKADFTLSK